MQGNANELEKNPRTLPHASQIAAVGSESPSNPETINSLCSDLAKEANDKNAADPPKVSCLAYAGYYLLVFFAYWFGVSRFDMDGDGDFDVEDVQLFIGNLGKVKQNFKKPGVGRQDSIQRQNSIESPEATSGMFSMLPPEMRKLETPGGSDSMERKMVQQTFPFYIVLQTIVAFGIWFVGSLQVTLNEGGHFTENRAGIDTFAPDLLDLRIVADGCQDLRFQLWRAITYQWTHMSISHIMFNSFMNVILGIPLEGLHGHLRVAFMYNIGVVGGACCYWVGDAKRSIVGMSGGCYSLIGIHVGSLIMNWKQVKFRRAILVFLTLLVTIDICAYLLSVGSEKVSHTTHVGGVVAGLIISVLVGENLNVKFHERVLQCFAIVTAGMLLVFCGAWLIFQDPPKHIQGDYGWCWLRQVYSPNRFGNKWQCVHCATKACIESFADVLPHFKLTVALSKCPDVFFEESLYPR